MELRRKPVKLANHISLVISLGLCFVFIVITLVSVKLLKDKLKYDFESRLNIILENYVASIAEPMWDYDEDQIIKISDGLKKIKFIDHIAVYDESGKRIYQKGNYVIESQDISLLAEKTARYFREIGFYYRGEYRRIGKVKVGVNFQEENNFILNFILLIFFLSFGLFLMLVIFIHKIIKRITKPLTMLTEKLGKLEDTTKVVELPDINSPVIEIKNLHNTMIFLKDHYENYQSSLEYTVAERTAELEDYKNHLEELVEEQTKDLVKARDEAVAANNIKSEFLANMSHELRTPMHAIINYSEMGINKGGAGDPGKILKYFTNISSASKRLLGLINEILDLTKLESGEISLNAENQCFLTMVNDVCNELTPLFENKNINLKKEVEKLPLAFFDREKIYRVVLNLLSNAIKFSPKDSEIVIDAVTNRIDGKTYIKFSVSDKGVGVPDNEIKKIFDKFYQSSNTKTGAGGTGLGLSICSKIIELHGGRIWAENRPDKGAVFRFLIPINPE